MPLHTLFYLILPTAKKGKSYYYSHFTDKNPEALWDDNDITASQWQNKNLNPDLW